MLMRRLSPDESPVDPAEAYAYPSPGLWVRANMIASVDGAATLEGRSGGLGGAADRHLFSVLRGLADAIVVGAGTVRAEGYGPPRPAPAWGSLRAGRSTTPALVIVSRSLDLDFGAPAFTEAAPDAPTVVLTAEDADPDRLRAARDRAEVITAGRDRVDFPAAFARLAAAGRPRLLCEGGPAVLAQVTAAGALDELCLTLSPVLGAGPAPRVLDGAPLPKPEELRLAHALQAAEDLPEEEGFLFLRYVRRR
ncbi:dihydrofolate reductase family protein [Actinomadura rugatobispora]|uniref:Dihydrofolate reductase family protein n=1 Tax=Actinomadura rugatobispora TaxID=1994 RepID=A0ABW0ZZT5_9ACTN|nr:pyrimidine reductase family protein [Actinomadura rugatobispora]